MSRKIIKRINENGDWESYDPNKNSIIRPNEDGYLECIDASTGYVRWTQAPHFKEDRKRKNLEKGYANAVKTKAKTREMEQVQQERKALVGFTESKAGKICELIANGNTIASIGRMENMPSQGSISNWLRRYPAFKAEYERAKIQRAEIRADEALDVARNATRETVAADKLLVETLKWTAQVNSPDSFGGKSKDSRDKGPVTVIVNTGIRRDEDECIEAEVINDDNSR